MVNGEVVEAITHQAQALFVGQVQDADEVKGKRDVHLRLLLLQVVDDDRV